MNTYEYKSLLSKLIDLYFALIITTLKGLDPKTGAIKTAFHTGLDKGQVGTGLKVNEMIAKLTGDEWVLTNKQMTNLTNNLNNIVPNQTPNIEIHVDKFMDIASMDSNVDINKLSKELSDKVMNEINNAYKMKFGKI